MVNELLFNIAIALAVVVGLLLLSCLCIRLIRQLKAYYRQQCQEYISMLVADVFVQTLRGVKSMDEIQSMVLLKRKVQSPFQRKLIMSELLHGLSLVTTDKAIFYEIYRALELTEFSLQKLRSESNEAKIEGAYELSQMRVTASMKMINILTTSNNRCVRLRGYLGLVQLVEDPVAIFENLPEVFTRWETEQIYLQLLNQSGAALLDFSPLLKNSHAPTVIFALRIISAFKHWNHFIKIRALTTSHDVRIAREAQSALNLLTHSSRQKRRYIPEQYQQLPQSA